MHSADYLAETSAIALNADLPEQIERMAAALSKIEGRVYMVGLGGSLANCIHMAADLRKLCNSPLASLIWIENVSSFIRTPRIVAPEDVTSSTSKKSSGTTASGATNDSRRNAELLLAPIPVSSGPKLEPWPRIM